MGCVGSKSSFRQWMDVRGGREELTLYDQVALAKRLYDEACGREGGALSPTVDQILLAQAQQRQLSSSNGTNSSNNSNAVTWKGVRVDWFVHVFCQSPYLKRLQEFGCELWFVQHFCVPEMIRRTAKGMESGGALLNHIDALVEQWDLVTLLQQMQQNTTMLGDHSAHALEAPPIVATQATTFVSCSKYHTLEQLVHVLQHQLVANDGNADDTYLWLDFLCVDPNILSFCSNNIAHHPQAQFCQALVDSLPGRIRSMRQTVLVLDREWFYQGGGHYSSNTDEEAALTSLQVLWELFLTSDANVPLKVLLLPKQPHEQQTDQQGPANHMSEHEEHPHWLRDCILEQATGPPSAAPTSIGSFNNNNGDDQSVASSSSASFSTSSGSSSAGTLDVMLRSISSIHVERAAAAAQQQQQQHIDDNGDASAVVQLVVQLIWERMNDIGIPHVNSRIVRILREWLCDEASAFLRQHRHHQQQQEQHSGNGQPAQESPEQDTNAPEAVSNKLRKRNSLYNKNDNLITPTPQVLHRVAQLLQERGKLAEAEPLLQQALDQRIHTLGEWHPSTLHTMNNLAALLTHQGKLAEAKPLLIQGLSAKRQLLGDVHSSTLSSMNNLAVLLYQQGQWNEAEPLIREACATSRKVLPEGHAVRLASLVNLARLLHDQERLEEAEPLLRQVLHGRRQTLGEWHVTTLQTMVTLARVVQDQGEWEAAKDLFTEALQGYRHVLGPTHLDTVSVERSVVLLEWRYCHLELVTAGQQQQQQQNRKRGGSIGTTRKQLKDDDGETERRKKSSSSEGGNDTRQKGTTPPPERVKTTTPEQVKTTEGQ